MIWQKTLLRLPVLIAALLAPQLGAHAADPQRGQRLFLYCAACHNLQVGQPAKVGPVLAGVVGARAASRQDYSYSDALKQSGLVWTDANLEKWLTQPAALVPGTKMAFIGLPKEADREAVIAYLRQLPH